ncbi:hypothetical protein NQ317_003704 [Molorchus minor]|uniref:HDAg domain-containing protein n=1 Tax=Molorchus minor TaxID=1323400 RepID=A0ABQ9K2F4_9CUCU|nr:hypothetical protein NQ317_003704 [Molorchus minor]
MANVRDSDTSLWLHNKLGISNDSWTGGSICSQLNAEVLRNIKDCFPDLQTQWKTELEQILDVAVADSELWVAMLADALKTYPATGSLNTEVSDVDEVGQRPEPLKHFTIKKKPKSALLRADLLQKSSDAASNVNKKSCAPVIPVRSRGMPRKMTDTSVLNSNLSNRPPLSRPPAGRKEGGVKLLDIADQPLGYTAAKRGNACRKSKIRRRRRRLQHYRVLPPATGATPDYAAGLTTTPAYAPATPQPSVTPTVAATTTTVLPTPQPVSQTTVVTQQAPQTAPPTPAPVPTPQPTLQYTAAATMRPVPPLLATTPSGQRTIITDQQIVQQQPQQIIGTPVVVTQRPVQQQQQTVTHIRIQPQPSANVLQRRGLALTREQMLEAQDMFRTANKVTRPEKALILGFMAGSRDNPCPHLGNIVTIKLSEDQENVLQPDDTYLTMMVETHFQMNYNNGEWKRIKKYRHIENIVDQITASAPTAALV